MKKHGARAVAQLVINKIPDEFRCYPEVEALIEALPDIFTIAFPEDEFGCIPTVSASTPNRTGCFWWRLNGAGVPTDLRYFIDGAWREVIDLLQTPQWRNGDSFNDRENFERNGYVLMDGSNGTTDLTYSFEEIPGSEPVSYSTYAVAFVGSQIIRG